MRLRGVVYDVGTVFRGPGWSIPTRPTLDMAVARREIGIIRDDLHCTAVKITGHDLRRVSAAAEEALRRDLDVWLGPTFFEGSPDQTVQYFLAAADVAEKLRHRFPERVTLIMGGELSLFMQGIIPGRAITERLTNMFQSVRAGDLACHDRLNAFLARASGAVREVFHGPLTYASLMGERVDWHPFDIVGVDHYREARVKDRYVAMLEPLLALGKPVVVTEFGMRTFAGAESSGALGFGIADSRSQWLHSLPLVGRFFRVRLRPGDWVRDEDLQARELSDTLAILDQAGVEGAFVSEFVTPEAPHRATPGYDVDMSAMSLVKSYERQRGRTYPDMAWEPKKSFWAVAEAYAAHTT